MDAKVIRGADTPREQTEWGSLQWLVAAANGASEQMTLGRVTFKPGQANPPHHHPNCEEILFVVQGQLEHTLPQGGTARLGPGDCIVLPTGHGHQATNVGEEEAVVIVAFSSADRQTVGE
ncbi:cupin domain-containing protein [Candidatus Sumerlaeota bacterium]